MSFFNIGSLEIVLILVIAILVVGPKRLVEMVQALRRLTDQLRRMSSEFTSNIQSEFDQIEREAGLDEEGESLADVVRDGLDPITGIQADLRATVRETRQALEKMVLSEPRARQSSQAPEQPAAEPGVEEQDETAG